MPQVLNNYDGLMFKVGFSQMRRLTQWKNLLHHKLALNEWNNIFINLSVNNKFPSFWGRQKMLNHSSASEELVSETIIIFNDLFKYIRIKSSVIRKIKVQLIRNGSNPIFDGLKAKFCPRIIAEQVLIWMSKRIVTRCA